MLWQKESSASDSLYINLLKDVHYPLRNLRLKRKKNNALSQLTRKDGNRKYSQKDMEGAMELYNESICFAEKNSEYLGLAYANRSSCFLKLQMYERCLVDISLAKDANYPVHLMPKLEKRKRECINKLGLLSRQSPIEPKLSFDADEKLPGIANVLQIERDPQFGRMVRAKCDIQIGETVLIEEAYIQCVYGMELNKCTTCTKEKMNFVPCENCVDAMYCSNECANNNFHQVECDMMVGADDFSQGESLSFVIRSLVIGINTFETIKEMMEFVENCLSTDPNEISESTASPRSKYRTFFKLSSFVTIRWISQYRKCAYIIYNAIMASSKLVDKFKTKASQRFLMHLIIHHGLILRMNAFGGYTEPIDGYFGDGGRSTTRDNDDKQFEKELHLITSYFNHSCLPNIIKLGKDNLAVCKAMLPIKKGEQLFITYINDESFAMTARARNNQLETIYGFRCKCQLCKWGLLHAEDAVHADPIFKYIVTNLPRLIGNFDNDLIQDLKTHCIDFLLKYPRLIATREAAFVLTNLVALMGKELMGR